MYIALLIGKGKHRFSKQSRVLNKLRMDKKLDIQLTAHGFPAPCISKRSSYWIDKPVKQLMGFLMMGKVL